MSSGHKIRVQVADDHDVVIQGLYSILKEQPDIEIVEPPITSGEDLLKNIRTAQAWINSLLLCRACVSSSSPLNEIPCW